jgi:aspartate racemase
MKKIGIVGGMGPESTLVYYKGISSAFHSSYDETGYPEITIESCNLKETLSYSERDRWDILAHVLAEKCNLLKQAGCDFGAIAANTPHKVFDEIQAGTDLPLVSIIQAACEFTIAQNLKKLCLLGTGFTMRSDFFQKIFHAQNIELFVPDADEIAYMHEKIFSELEFGIIKSPTRDKFISITKRVVDENNCDGAIMGCTELPLIINPDDIPVAYLDTTAIHINKIAAMCRE